MSTKRRFGDRPDGRWVRDVPGLQVIMGHLLPNRTDSEVYLHERFDLKRKTPRIRTTKRRCFTASS